MNELALFLAVVRRLREACLLRGATLCFCVFCLCFRDLVFCWRVFLSVCLTFWSDLRIFLSLDLLEELIF